MHPKQAENNNSHAVLLVPSDLRADPVAHWWSAAFVVVRIWYVHGRRCVVSQPISENAFPQYPTCMLCRDTGLCYQEIWRPAPWRFCTCPAGVSRLAAEPDLIDESNDLYAKQRGGQ